MYERCVNLSQIQYRSASTLTSTPPERLPRAIRRLPSYFHHPTLYFFGPERFFYSVIVALSRLAGLFRLQEYRSASR